MRPRGRRKASTQAERRRVDQAAEKREKRPAAYAFREELRRASEDRERSHRKRPPRQGDVQTPVRGRARGAAETRRGSHPAEPALVAEQGRKEFVGDSWIEEVEEARRVRVIRDPAA